MFLTIDQGTTSSRALLFDENCHVIDSCQKEFNQIYPDNGWVEIWETQLKAIKNVVNLAKIDFEEIDSIGITNQRETTVVWNKNTGKPVYNAIVWQDRRTASICEDLKNKGKSDVFYNKTGLILDAYFSGTKIKWILDSDKKIRDQAIKGDLLFGTIDTWLIWNLTSKKIHATDCTNASRTLLYNIHKLDWDQELISLLDIPEIILPKVFNSSEKIGYTDATILGASIPICGVAGDQQAALFGQMCINPGDVKNTYGTGCFCMMNTGTKAVKSNNRMLTTIAWKIDDTPTYALEGSVFIAGALVQWLRDQLNVIKNTSEIEDLAKSVSDNGGVTFISALSGLGAPYWNPNATGAIMGITRGTQKGHIARLQSISLQTLDLMNAIKSDFSQNNIELSSLLKVDGGMIENQWFIQNLSSICNYQIYKASMKESTALGTALMSGIGVGFYSGVDDLQNLSIKRDHISPSMSPNLRNDIILNWNKAVKLTIEMAKQNNV